MPNSKRPAGPNRPLTERKEAVTEREELDELSGDDTDADLGLGMPKANESARAAGHADRNAHSEDGGRSGEGGGRGGNS